MNRDQELGAVRKGFHMCRDELTNSQFEVRRLQAIIKRAALDLAEMSLTDEQLHVVDRLDSEMRGLVECTCGKLWGHDQLVWRDWNDFSLQIADCTMCSSTVSRTMVK